MPNQHLTVQNLEADDGHLALHDLTFDVGARTVHAVLGTSGSGKSLLLRTLAGLEKASRGFVELNGRKLLASSEAHVSPPEVRQIAYVFPDFALFPNLSVRGNISFGITAAKAGIANEILERMNIVYLADTPVRELTRSEQLKIAIARALAQSPELVLLDDVLRNLPSEVQDTTRSWVFKHLHDFGCTVVFASRDARHAMGCDTMSVLHDGRLLQTGTPQHLYEYPANARVAALTGDAQFFPAQITPDRRYVETLLGRVPIYGNEHSGYVLIRPEHVTVEPNETPSQGHIARVVQRWFQGPDVLCELRFDGGLSLLARVRRWDLPKTDRVKVRVARPCFMMSDTSIDTQFGG